MLTYSRECGVTYGARVGVHLAPFIVVWLVADFEAQDTARGQAGSGIGNLAPGEGDVQVKHVDAHAEPAGSTPQS